MHHENRTSRGPLALLSSLVALGVTACSEGAQPYAIAVGTELREVELALDVRHAHVQGDLGEVVGFQADADETRSFDDGVSTEVALWAGGGAGAKRWATMTAFSLSGEARARFFTPGETLSFGVGEGSSELGSYSCSGVGADADQLAFEADPVSTEISVHESDVPGMVTIQFDAEYFTDLGVQHIEGSFEIAVPPA